MSKVLFSRLASAIKIDLWQHTKEKKIFYQEMLLSDFVYIFFKYEDRSVIHRLLIEYECNFS